MIRQKVLRVIQLAFIPLVLTAACKSSGSLTGSWTDGQGIDYKFDDTGQVTRYVFAAGSAAVYSGAYHLKGDQLTITFTRGDSPDPKAKSAAESIVTFQPTSSFRLIRISPDTIQLQGKYSTMTLKKQ